MILPTVARAADQPSFTSDKIVAVAITVSDTALIAIAVLFIVHDTLMIAHANFIRASAVSVRSARSVDFQAFVLDIEVLLTSDGGIAPFVAFVVVARIIPRTLSVPITKFTN